MQSGSFQTSNPGFVPNDLHRLPSVAEMRASALTASFRSPFHALESERKALDRRSESEIDRDDRENEPEIRSVRQIEASHLLSNGLAHDLNNLFQVATSALSLIELRSKLGRDVDIPALVEKAELALDRAKTVVRRLTLLPVQSRGDVGPVDVNSTVHTLHGLFALLAGTAIDVRLDLTPSSACIACNRLDFENALLNVVANARNAIANGGMIAVETSVERRSSVGPDSAGNAYAVVRISDTGHGMTPEIAARAFDAFYSTRAEHGGTGLGLAMVRRFLNDVGGTSVIESAIGIGTSISLFLPILEQSPTSDASARPDR